MYEGLRNLQDLTMAHNQLSSIDQFAFTGLPELKRLDLSDNKIDSIHRDTFKNLSKLSSIIEGLSQLVELKV